MKRPRSQKILSINEIPEEERNPVNEFTAGLKVDLERFEKQRMIMYETPSTGTSLHYAWSEDSEINFSNDHHIRVVQYNEMFSMDICNSIALLRNSIKKIEAWIKVSNGEDNSDGKDDIFFKFIRSDLYLSICLPSSLRDKMAFALIQIAHQLNLQDGTSAEQGLGDNNSIKFHHAKRFKNKWPDHSIFFVKICDLANRDFDTATENFRNSFNHKVTPQMIGIKTGLLREILSEKRAEQLNLQSLEVQNCYGTFTSIGSNGEYYEENASDAYNHKVGEVCYIELTGKTLKPEDIVQPLKHQLSIAIECFDFLKSFMRYAEKQSKIGDYIA